MRLMIAIPAFGGKCDMGTAEALFEFKGALSKAKINVELESVWNEAVISKGRNYLAHRFMESRCTHLLFVDADVMFKPDEAIRMLKVDLDIVAAAYPRKLIAWDRVHKLAQTRPWPMLRHASCDCVLRPLPDAKFGPPDEPLEVVGAATGFMLIKRNVLEVMAKSVPISRIMLPNRTGEVDIPTFFDFEIDPDTKYYLPEDYVFCRRARAAGFRIWLAPWMTMKHIGSMIFEGCIYCSHGLLIHEMEKR